VPWQLGQWDLAFAIAHRDVVNRSLADQPGHPLLLLRQQRFEPMCGSLADQHDAGPPDNPMHGVQLTGARDGRRHLPPAA
jgi:hypothetical protein